MIYVTVGKMPLPFDRLIRAADEAAPALGEEVFIQAGSCAYKPAHSAYRDFLPFPEAEDFLGRASVIVSHAGIGTIIGALRAGTPIVVVPRREALKEHFNDHQLEIAEAVKGRPGVEVVHDIARLGEAIKRLQGLKGKVRPERPGEGIISAISEFLDSKAGV